MLWTVYVSEDNFTWTLISPAALSVFNLPNDRYELTFEPLRTSSGGPLPPVR